MFMESWILRVTLQEIRSIHDSMNIPKIEFILKWIYVLIRLNKIKFDSRSIRCVRLCIENIPDTTVWQSQCES